MIIQLPILNATPPDSGVSAQFGFANNRFGLKFALNNAVIFHSVMPNTYEGNSINVHLYWNFPTGSGTQSATWQVSFQELDTGAILSTYSFSTERSGSGSSGTLHEIIKTTINLPVGDLSAILPGTLFRLKIRCSALVGSPLLHDILLDNGS